MNRDISAETWAITGAAGRIGSTLREGLRGSVAELVLIDALPIEAGPGERSVQAELGDPAALRDALQGADGVIHLAAISDEADFHDLAEVNIVGTWHLLEAARQAGVTRVVYASTGRTIGMYDVSETVTLDMRTRPDGLYAVSKVAGEALCSLYADKFGMRTTCIRIGAFLPEPNSDRAISVWLSEADAVRAFTAAMSHEGPDFTTFFAYSNNDHLWVDIEPGRALGYEPRDNASEHRPGPPIAKGRQAGRMGEPGFTLDKQRQF